MYDLTSMLTTISAGSASFVAILGGLIASKLLSINGERESVKESMESLENKVDFLQKQNANLQAELDESDALDFISQHLDGLCKKQCLESNYPQNEQYNISWQRLSPYWDRAVGVVYEFLHEINEAKNSEGIPNSLAMKYSTNNFVYSVLRLIAKKWSDVNEFTFNSYFQMSTL